MRGFKEGEAEVKKEAEGIGLNAKRKGRGLCKEEGRGYKEGDESKGLREGR